MKLAFSLKLLFLAVTVVAVACVGLITLFQLRQRDLQENLFLPNLLRQGFHARRNEGELYVDRVTLKVPKINLTTAVSMIGIGTRYRFVVEDCDVTDEAVRALRSNEARLKGVDIVDCTMTQEPPSGIFDYSIPIDMDSKNFYFGKSKKLGQPATSK